MKKRFLTIVLIISFFCAVLPQFTMPVRAKDGTSGTCGENLTWNFDPGTGTLTISGSGFMDDFEDDCPWRDYSGQITSVRLPDALMSIGVQAFRDCSRLSSITIPSNVIYIGYTAFLGCSSLQSLVIPDGVEYIEPATFAGCTSLQSVAIPNSVIWIGSEAFRLCSNLTSVDIPSGVKSIGDSAFRYCEKLESFSLPDGLEELGGFAFLNTVYYNNPNNWDSGLLYYGKWLMEANREIVNAIIRPGTVHIADDIFNGKHTLASVTIPDSVESIGERAFIGCELLTSVKIPSSVKRIGSGAFDYTGYYNNMSKWSNGLLYLDDWLISVDPATSNELTSVNVRPGTKGIVDELFDMHDKLTSVTLPDGLRYIGRNTFDCCWNLRQLTLPNSVESIGRRAFSQCYGLTSISIPSSLKHMEENAFSWCENLTALTIPNGITSISDYAFYGCDKITRLVIPESVTSIGLAAFGDWDDYKYKRFFLILNRDCEFYDNTGAFGLPENTILYGYSGSTTEDYARKYDYQFKDIEKTDFIDVEDDAYYSEPVKWAVEMGVTTGTSPYVFQPDSTCTRAQVVTFLWRAKGELEPTKSDNPFTDITSGKYYYRAVLWAVENGITTGTSSTAFSPNTGCTRAQVVTFLWRSAGKPEPKSGTNPFNDVRSDAYYYKAVQWAVEQGITKGTSANKFSPDSTCTRGQIVTFLYRDLAE